MTMAHRLEIKRDKRKGREHLHRMRGTLRKGEPRYDRSFTSKKAAMKVRSRLERDLDRAGELQSKVIKEARLAHDLLMTTESNPDAQGKSLLFAVRWFVARYRNTAEELSVAEYAKTYLEKVKAALAEATYQEAKYYLDPLCIVFGSRKPSTLTVSELESHLTSLKHRFNRDKVLRGFFRWLAGGRRKRLPIIEGKPPLGTSPFQHIVAPELPKRKKPPLILTNEEARKLLENAIPYGTLDYVAVGLFLGLRPESELPPFLEASSELIDLEKKEVTLRTSKVAASAHRDIHIRAGLCAFLDSKKGSLSLPRGLAKRLRKTKAFLAPEKRKESDILRHTFLSNLVAAESIDVAVMEGGTSVKMLKRNYWRRVPKKDAEAFFQIVPKRPKQTRKQSIPKSVEQVAAAG